MHIFLILLKIISIDASFIMWEKAETNKDPSAVPLMASSERVI